MLNAPESSLVAECRPHRLGVWFGRMLAVYYRITGKDRYDDYRLERMLGLSILVMPSVANPKLLRTGEFLASKLDEVLIESGTEVLDLGTGSGVCALVSARYSDHVTAVDINPAAIRCARINALINSVDNQVEFLHGDLFEPCENRRFDLIVFNPPFLVGRPKDQRDATWRSPDLAERFAGALSAHLNPGGAALVVLSTFGDACTLFESALTQHQFRLEAFARRRYINEVLTIIKATLASASSAD